MEDGEPEAMVLWEKFRAISIDYYAEMYARLNIKFDEYSGESQVSLNSEAVAEVESLLKQKDICEEQNGALVIDFDKHGGKGTAALRDRNGSTTYLLRDIATVLERFKSHAFDKMVYVVCEQDVHFRQVIKAVELMGLGDVASKLQHLTFTRINIGLAPQLETTSTLQLGDILDHCEKTMHAAIVASPDQYPYQGGEGDATAIAKVIGINSMVLHDLSLSLRKGHGNGLDFNLLVLSEAETGTGLQLCYTRLCAALAAIGTSPYPEEISHTDFAAFSEPPWSEVLRLLVRYPDATKSAFEKQDPSPVLSYLFRLAEEVMYCLDEANDGESDGAGESSAAALQYANRAVLYESVRQVLENGMKLLGATPIWK
jgi:arginyl-tRNA synthetase